VSCHDLFVHYLIRFVADELSVSLESFGGFAAEQRKHRDNQDRQQE
jgi:nucleoid DNA-binding protein